MGLPFSAEDLRNYAAAISGKDVGKQWHKKFLKRNPQVCAMKPAKLDPKRAKNFNETIINDYFDKIEGLHEKYDGIPPEHIWNMDEKGIQLGGGRKKSSKKFFFMKGQKDKYRIRNDNLELSTILECILAAGDAVPPSFCLQNGSIPDLRELDDECWGRFANISSSPFISVMLTLNQAFIFQNQDGPTRTIANVGSIRCSFRMPKKKG